MKKKLQIDKYKRNISDIEITSVVLVLFQAVVVAVDDKLREVHLSQTYKNRFLRAVSSCGVCDARP